MIFFIVITLIFYQALLVLMHFVIYGTLIMAFGGGSIPLEVLFVFFSITFGTATALAYRYDNIAVRWYYRFAMHWFGLVDFLFVGGVLFYFFEKLLYGHDHYLPSALIGACCFGASVLIYLYSAYKAATPEVTRLSVTLPGLPGSWHGKKVVFVSDVHLGDIWHRPFAEKVVRKIAALKPEAVLIGGDMYDGVKCDLQNIVAPFAALRTPLGVYFATGNHDYIRDAERGFAAIRSTGIRILNNEKVDLDGIQLVGFDYKATEHREEFVRLLKEVDIDPSRPSIMVRHVPDHLNEAEEAGVSLALFGHTHAGQIFPISLFIRQQYGKFYYGLHRLHGMWAYTSSGVGTWGAPLRLGTKSEIMLIEFK